MTTSKTPKTKSEFYTRYHAGEFGNKPETWKNFQELYESSYRKQVTIRDMNPARHCAYNIEVLDLIAGKWPSKFSPANSRFNESMPDDKLLIQGNAFIAVGGLTLEYSCEKNIGHRLAVRQPYLKSAQRLSAISLLRTYLGPSDLDDLLELLEVYDDAIVEFGTYSVPVGIIPGRNTVFWEVRAY